MTEEAIQQVCVPTEPAEAAAGHTVQLSDRGRHGVEQVAFDPAVAQLLGIELGRVGRQPLDLIVCGWAASKACTGLARCACSRSQMTSSGRPI